MITPIEALKYFKGRIDWITTGLDVQYYIDKDNEGNVVIAFQGSNSKLDWKQNFKFWKKPYKNMKVKFRVHSGFLEIWKSCRDEIMNRLEEMNPTSITVVGHSLGGSKDLYLFFAWKIVISDLERQENYRKINYNALLLVHHA